MLFRPPDDGSGAVGGNRYSGGHPRLIHMRGLSCCPDKETGL